MTVYETSFYCIRIVFLLYFAVNDRWYYLVLRPVDLVIGEHFKQMFQCKNFQEFESLVLRGKNNNRLFSSQFANFKWSNCPNEIMLTAFNIIWTDGYFRFQPKNIQLSKLSTHMSSKSTGKRNRFWWPKIKMKMCASNSFCPSPCHRLLWNHVFFPLNIDELLVTKSIFKWNNPHKKRNWFNFLFVLILLWQSRIGLFKNGKWNESA